ncbi:MAG: energy-coupling factor transporter transmembrane protein EcfT [Clostridia bacterium]|nr:energy-coupling factor transporter transmembrane protein EcfT [Clostridia bacterium]
MLNDITFGQYFETSSIIHKLDARIKMILLILQIVFIFLANNLISLSVAFGFVLLIILLSKVPLRMYLKNLKAILPIILFTAIINLFYGNEGRELFSFWKITVTSGGVINSIFLTARIVLLIIISSVLTYTTTPNDLTDAIERLLSPLRFLGLKNAVHTLAMMMTIALRFIPTLVEETQKIMNAQKARGVDFENGKLKERINALIPILIPLLISSVRRAYELAEAMECRCYNGAEGRKRMKQFKIRYYDILSALISVVFCLGIIFVNFVTG